MLNSVYRLVAPRRFETEFNDVDLTGDKVIVRPTHLSICNADQRYYQGLRPAEVLAKKLPMALIHEGIGNVVYDPKGEFKQGTLVVMIPNTPYEKDEIIAENYLRSSKFRASGFDGFMQDSVALDRDRVVELPQDINREAAAFTEFVTVCYHAINRFFDISHKRRNEVGIWGDGNLAYVVALLLHYRSPETRIYVMGKHRDKLEKFSFVEECYSITDIPEDLGIDHAFECVGGNGAPSAINQIIDYIRPEGTISLMGVTEDLAPVNTRMILEKGLRVYGSSRSGRQDYLDIVEFYKENPEVIGYLENIIAAVIDVRELSDFNKAFDADIRKIDGKTVMLWNK